METVALDIEPDPDDPRQALAFLTILANGHPTRVLLDSGSSQTAITAPDATPTWSATPEGTGAFGIPGEVERRWSAHLHIGNVDFGHHDITDQPNEQPNILGQDLLSRFCCNYELAERRLTIDAPPPQKPKRIYIDQGRHVYLTVTWPLTTPA